MDGQCVDKVSCKYVTKQTCLIFQSFLTGLSFIDFQIELLHTRIWKSQNWFCESSPVEYLIIIRTPEVCNTIYG